MLGAALVAGTTTGCNRYSQCRHMEAMTTMGETTVDDLPRIRISPGSASDPDAGAVFIDYTLVNQEVENDCRMAFYRVPQGAEVQLPELQAEGPAPPALDGGAELVHEIVLPRALRYERVIHGSLSPDGRSLELDEAQLPTESHDIRIASCPEPDLRFSFEIDAIVCAEGRIPNSSELPTLTFP